MAGLHQVEAGHTESGEPERRFYLASIGLAWLSPSQAETSATFKLSALADSILAEMTTAEISQDTVAWFIQAMREYGTDPNRGYDHTDIDSRHLYDRPFAIAFARLYDMADPGVQVMRSDDVVSHPFTDASSLRFRINLPDQVGGDFNPTVGMGQIAQTIVG
ncbi:hypothetical protein NOCARDAX2BIS_540017 [Nocardioides sp. AX2bis]|nr:hypothetical protein NOCARDAX2BIS_540017 [Nocardioides sp. AX2bis]